MKEKPSEVKKGKIPIFIIIITVIIQLLLASVLSLLLVTRGPFNNIRKDLISAVMMTYSHQYIATMLFTKEQIDAVVAPKLNTNVNSQDISQVKPQLYNDSNITLEQITSNDGSYSGYLLEISDPLRVQLAYTDYLGKVGELTSSMAKEHNAVAAINGGGFGDSAWAGTGAIPDDFIIADGQLIYKNQDYTDDTPFDVIAINDEGQLIVGAHSINYLLSLPTKVISAVALDGYPPIVVDGKGTFSSAQEAVSLYSWQPRTAIGQTANGTILMLVLDGRQMRNGVLMKGATLYDVQKIMLDYGAVTAANLDGGNSTTMYYNGNVINSPSGELGERTVSTAFYVEQ